MRFFAVERTFYKVKSRNDSIVNNGTAAVKKVAVKNQIDGSYILVKTREPQLFKAFGIGFFGFAKYPFSSVFRYCIPAVEDNNGIV